MSAEQPGQVLWASALGVPQRGGREGASSLIPAGPSLSLFGHLVLQHHIGDEHSYKQQQHETGGQWDGNGIGSGQKVLVDDMLAVDEWQENHPDGVVGEDDQANSNEAKSHHLVCPRGHFPGAPPRSSKPHPVPDPGPSLWGTPGVVVYRPPQDYVAQDRQAPPPRLHVGKCSFLKVLWNKLFTILPREWDRVGNPDWLVLVASVLSKEKPISK